MRLRKLNLWAAAATFVIISCFAANLLADKKPNAKSKEASAAAAPAPAENKPEIPDLEFITRLRQEEYGHGQAMDLMSYLTDQIGARLTGSPNMKKANEWTRDEFTKWELVNAHLEPWGTFGRGWSYQFCEVRMVSPDIMQFLALPEAWTPGTGGPLRAEVTHMIATTSADLEKYKGKLAGKIVLFGEARVPDPSEKPLFRRDDAEELSNIALFERPPLPGAPPRPPGPAGPRREEMMQRFKFQEEFPKFLADEHVAAVLDITRNPGEDGTIFVQSGGSYDKGKTIAVPRVTLSVEHFGRMARLLEKKVHVEVEMNVETTFYDDDDKAYNTLAEIPGVDPTLKDQVVMLGGHLDSWHGGEGATDNGAGSVVGMESVRLLKKLGVQPRRTIRIALWSGEEEGLLGSRGYVKEHFGSRPESTKPEDQHLPAFMRPPAGPLELKPEQKQISVYFNLDNGAGMIRGVYLQENAQVKPIFEKWMEPFKDLGMTTLTMRNTGSTDHVSFDAMGIPAFEFLQDPLDYGTLTHHSNLDAYEHIRPSDLQQASTIMADFVYNAAMCDEMIPRKPIRPDDPPEKQDSPGGGEKPGPRSQ
jgi:carboxypeptidase Q